MKRTKIICTLGPASSDPAVLEKMIRNGMNIARLNFSHGSYEEHAKRIRLVRETAQKVGTHVGILADLQGPKIRIGTLEQEPLILKEGQRLILTINSARQGESGVVFVDYPTLVKDVMVGGQLYLADGMIGLKVNSCSKDSLDCEVLNEGELTSHKGVTLPGVSVNLPALTEKDRSDLEFVIRSQVDFIAISFARRAEHLAEIRALVAQQGGKQLLIAKIENQEGVNNSPAIIKECDGFMVARGDLGVEVPLEEVPLIQRYLIELCNSAGKPVITATEMLESMIRNPRPTRAEITDIAHAILDGTDAIMLSAETAVGKYPATAVEMMNRVAQKMENSLKYEEILAKKKVAEGPSVADAISHATCQAAFDLQVKAIICSTQSGSTARMVSKYRPKVPIMAATPYESVARQLTISWGVSPVIVPFSKDIDSMIDAGVVAAKDNGWVRPHDLVVISAGVRTGVPGSTNLLKVHEVE
ncbi:MAG TPA: pyruvate kinase [Bacillota bacterium]|nr:pyruvate kinase [Bacillota bacterium]